MSISAKKTGAWFSLPLFFCIAVAGNFAEAPQKPADCKFSLKDEVPKNVKFTVQPGRIAFLCKTEVFSLNGSVTRTLGWQLTGRIFETMAEITKAETIEKWPSGRLYRIASDKDSAKRVVCGYHTRESYSMELCAPETTGDNARNNIKEILDEFRKIALESSPLLKSAALYSQKKVFTEENETREPALLALMMPPGYVEVTRRENRALFTDAAGLAEMEIFYELSDLALDSELAHRVYRKTITSFLSRQGSWQAEKDTEAQKSADSVCLVFTDNGKKLSHYCYAVVPLIQAGKKRYCRIAFVAAFIRDAVDRSKLLAEQQALLNGWAAIIRKHAS